MYVGLCMYYQGGQFTRLSDPDLEKIKMNVTEYYDFFAKLDDDSVVFTVPYNDSGGLGRSIHSNVRLKCAPTICHVMEVCSRYGNIGCPMWAAMGQEQTSNVFFVKKSQLE